MGLLVSLVCDGCGESPPLSVSCTDRAPRSAIREAKLDKGWRRHKTSKYGDHIDLCPICASKLPRPAKVRKPRPKLVARGKGVVIPFPAKGSG